MSDSEKPEENTEIEITPEMIEAGVFEMRGRGFGEPLERVVADIFLAMAIESKDYVRVAASAVKEVM